MKFFLPHSIRGIVLLIVALALLPALALLGYSAWKESREALGGADAIAVNTAHELAREQRLVTEGARTLLTTLAQLRQIKTQDAAACRALFQNLLLHSPMYSDIRLFDAKGNTVASGMPDIGMSPPVIGAEDLVFFQTSKAFSARRLSSLIQQGIPEISCFYPLWDGDTFSGVLMVSLIVSVPEKFLSELREKNVLRVSIVDDMAQLLFVRSFFDAERYREGSLLGIERDILKNTPPNEHLVHWPADPENAVVAFERLGFSDGAPPYFSVLVAACKIPSLESASHIHKRSFALVCFIVLWALAISWQLYRIAFFKPIASLRQAFSRLQQTESGVRLQGEAMTSELGLLGDSFNTMVESLERRESELVDARNEAAAAAKGKSEFLANMSHEMRTPMNAVLGMVYLVKRTELTERQQNYLSKIHSSASELLAVINDILDFSKIEAGKVHIERTAFNLYAALEKMFSTYRRAARSKGLSFSSSIAQEVPRYVRGDELHLIQTLSYLLHNAVAYTKRGDIRASCAVILEQCGEVSLLFQITDTGPGMTRAQLNKFFPKADDSGSSPTLQGGSGLSLAITRKLVGLMEGSIEVHSVEGKGTCINVRVDMQVAAAGEVASHAEPDIRRVPQYRVLVHDSRASTRDELLEALQNLGMSVEACESPEAVLERLSDANTNEDTCYHIVLFDEHILRQGDEHFFMRLKQMPRLTVVPAVILVISGRSEAVRIDDTDGVDLLLYRPFDASTLLNTLQESLEQANLIDTVHFKEMGTQASVLTLQNRRILLVEDNALNQQVAEEILSGSGAEVVLAVNGEEALRILGDREASQVFDLVLMDLQMPVMDGFEASRRIRENPEFAKMPIIAMTAHTMDAQWEVCSYAGMNDFVTKPIDVEQFFSVLAKWLRD